MLHFTQSIQHGLKHARVKVYKNVQALRATAGFKYWNNQSGQSGFNECWEQNKTNIDV